MEGGFETMIQRAIMMGVGLKEIGRAAEDCAIRCATVLGGRKPKRAALAARRHRPGTCRQGSPCGASKRPALSMARRRVIEASLVAYLLRSSRPRRA